MAGQFPFYILREWDNSGKLLSGGLIYLYESGTLTPKAAFTDSTYTIALPNPVVLDAGGAADVWLGDGAYRVLVKSSTGVQIRPYIDGVTGVGGGGFGQDGASATAVALYANLRALTTAPDLVYVSGATAEGDGGQGWFQKLPGISTTDDNGISLVTTVGSIAYQRIFDASIDPLWYGVKYTTSVDNGTQMTAALAASVRWNFPVQIAGSVFLLQNITVPDGAAIHANIDGFFNSGIAVSITFATGSKLSSDGVVFGETVNPIFGKGVAPALLLSWFGGATDDSRWTKAAASTTNEYKLIADIDTSSTGVTTPANFEVDFAAGAKIIFSGAANLSVGNLAYQGASQIVSWPAIANVGTVAVGPRAAHPEWFGAVGDGTADDALGFLAAAKTGLVWLTNGKNYLLGATWTTTPTTLALKGADGPLANQVTLGTGKTLGTGVLSLDSVLVSKADVGNWFAGTFLAAVSSEFNSSYTATTASVVGCKITGDTYFPVFSGFPKLYNGHIDLASAQILGTNAAGKLVEGKANLPASAPILGTSPDGTIVNVGDSPALDMLNFSSMFFASWSVAPLAGTVTLTNPMKFIYMVDNRSATADITLPVPGSGHPTLVIFFPMRRVNSVTYRGTFSTIGGGVITSALAILMYYDRASSAWVFISSDA